VLEVGELDDPIPGPGEVRVRVLASAINPTDLYARSGARGARAPARRVVPHQDGSGVVDMVGPGVPPTRIGELVWFAMTRRDGDRGTAAELCVVAAARAVTAPPGSDPVLLACIGIPWITAYATAAMEGGDRPTREREPTLVDGGAGAVGNFAIQAARLLGQIPIATVSSDAGRELAERAGAASVVHRSGTAAADVLAATAGEGVARAIEVDLAANMDLLLEVVRPGGLIVVYGTGGKTASLPVSTALRRRIALRFVYAYDLPDTAVRAAIDAASGLVTSERLVHLPALTFPLSEVAAAHEAAEAGGGGRRVVCVPA
jgi:NADPH2:quinone reductase